MKIARRFAYGLRMAVVVPLSVLFAVGRFIWRRTSVFLRIHRLTGPLLLLVCVTIVMTLLFGRGLWHVPVFAGDFQPRHVGFALWLLVAVFAFVPRLQLWRLTGKGEEEKWLDADNKARQTLLQLAGGAVVLVGTFVAYKQYQAQSKLSAGQLQATRESLDATRRAQFNERFARAVENLGSLSLHVRIAGVYALEQLTREVPDRQRTTVEALAAFVRDRSPWRPGSRELPTQAHDWGPRQPGMPVREEIAASADVQAAVAVLGRNSWPAVGEVFTGNQRLVRDTIDLSGTDLRGADLSEFQWRTGKAQPIAPQQRVSLQLAHLDRGMLARVNFRGAILIGATFREAWLYGARLEKAQADGADFRWADLREAYFYNADLASAQFDGASLESAHFDGAFLGKTSFRNASIGDASLRVWGPLDADFAGATFDGTGLPLDLCAAQNLTITQIERALFPDQGNVVLPEHLKTAKIVRDSDPSPPSPQPSKAP